MLKAIVLGAGLVAASAAMPAHAASYMKDYCDNQVYFPSTAEPHLHCDKSWIVYTAVGHSHKDLIRGDQVRCPAIREVLTTHTAGAIHDSVQRMSNDYRC
ncbi:MAG TPA: hypothetical protein VGF56_10420 [Rhizomicrobium sp.]|jgi:hypothetical protein